LVCFSGGEAFLLGDDLAELIAACSASGFITRVVTNGYWAKSRAAATSRLQPLVEAGLNEINFSTGDDHVRFVPLESVVLGLAVSVECGLTTALMIETRLGQQVTKGMIVQRAEPFPLLQSGLRDGTIPVLESPWIKFSDDPEVIEHEVPQLLNASNVGSRPPCNSVLTTIVVSPSEELGLCCGLPREEIPDLRAGSLQEKTMRDLVDGCKHDFLKIWLFTEGPEKILAWAASKDPSIEWENMYAHNCDACRRLYRDPTVQRVIEEHYQEKVDEVLFKYALYLQKTADSGRT
jgi:hypothetical protein